MLNKIRKSTDSLIVRIILGLIAISFVGFGATGLLNGNSRGDIVSFSEVDSISFEEFMMVKYREIDRIQKHNGVNLSEEDIASKNLDKDILQAMINQSMIKYLAQIYNFDISDEKVAEIIQKLPYFKNQNGEFDASIFKASFLNAKNKEIEFIKDIKKDLIANAITDGFSRSFVPAKIMTDNLINYMSEKKEVEVVSIDMGYKPQSFSTPLADDKTLEDLYNKNEDSFIIPEIRSFSYAKLPYTALAKDLKISEKELIEYYEDNKSDFQEKNFKGAKGKVKEALMALKVEDSINNLSKKLESDIASGMSLKEISAKYKFGEIKIIKDKSLQDLKSMTKLDIIDYADNIFEMNENELSYPIELNDTKELLLMEINSIIPSRSQPFAEVKDQLQNIWQKRQLAEENYKSIFELQKNYNSVKLSDTELQSKGIILQQKSYIRAELPEEGTPPMLYNAIFSNTVKQTTPLIKFGDKIYFAYVKSSAIDNKMTQKLQKNSINQLSAAINEGIMHEIIGHLTEKNKMKVNVD